MLMDYLLVVVGGGMGALVRALIARALPFSPEQGFPWAILGINVVGSFALGACVGWHRESPRLWALVGVGFCGGLTTFSTFSLDVFRLFHGGRVVVALLYAIANFSLALLAVTLGYFWIGSRG
jgi:CrcB protein